MIASADGSIRLAKPHQKFFDVETWGAIALTSAAEFCRLKIQHDPRIVKFNILEYLFYLQTTFLKFKRFKFKQVLLYDRAYRAYQLRERLTWGTYVPELYEFYLSGYNRSIPSTESGWKMPYKASPVSPEKIRRPVRSCDQFNAGMQCKFTPCKYAHVCLFCQMGHLAIRCPKVKAKTPGVQVS